MAIDKDLIRELELFSDNDQQSYKKLMAINQNYALKRKKGIWDKKKAITGLSNLHSTFVVSRYRKEYGLGSVSKEDKMALAKETYKKLWDDYGLKNIKKAKKIKKKKR